MKLSVTQQINQIDAAAWNNLCADKNPFLSHEFLNGLESSGCVHPDTGWEPNHLVLYGDDDGSNAPLGAIPLYLKYHSWGEYVFDWAWANAYERAGLDYYPKLLCAVPFTPVTGPRLLIDPAQPDPDKVRAALAHGLITLAKDSGASSLHVLFTTEQDTDALEQKGLMRRTGNQFHWRNNNYENFAHYLTSFTAVKRKKILRERRRVREAGIYMEVHSGDSLERRHWDAMYGFYRLTVYNHGAAAYLNRDFFDYLQEHMVDRAVIVLAWDGQRYVGGTLNILGADALYGRYWGAAEYYDGLHFEACYYQPIEYCIENGIGRFEAGAQGEHKLSRGLLPTPTYSTHWLRDTRFRHAIADFLQAETEHVGRYSDVLHGHTPFKSC